MSVARRAPRRRRRRRRRARPRRLHRVRRGRRRGHRHRPRRRQARRASGLERADVVDLLDAEATTAWARSLGDVDALLHLVGGWKGGHADRRGRPRRLGPAPRPARPHRPAHLARLPARAARQRARALRADQRQAGLAADVEQRRLRGGQGRGRGVDARPGRRAQGDRGDRERRRRQRDRRRQAVLHPRRADRRHARVAVLGRGGEDERQAGGAPPVSRGFASDNYAGAHPAVLAALGEANGDHAVAYGADPLDGAARGRDPRALRRAGARSSRCSTAPPPTSSASRR